nr:UDP-N-acetylglucosamine 1-carboxyvinyltransferase [Bacteriovoracaceae bacterium]
MDKLIIEGPAKLSGSVEVSSAKNACLPILAAVLLNTKPVTIQKIPKLRDISTMQDLLQKLGTTIVSSGEDIILDGSTVNSVTALYELVKTMRASILVLGPLLARFGEAHVSLPGGCAIGARPVDIHLEGLKKMGAVIDISAGYVHAKTSGLKGAHYVMPFPSVGATENLMMAAVLAEGKTILENVAQEPEIEELQVFLNHMGAKVTGAGTRLIEIEGVKELKSTTYQVEGDRIEAATYVMAGLITGSHITVTNIRPQKIMSVLEKLESMGAQFNLGEKHIEVLAVKNLKGCRVDTAPFPGFPTDVQAQMMALCLTATTSSLISEHIFENRFMHVPELIRMGANIVLEGHSAHIESSKLTGAPVMC